MDIYGYMAIGWLITIIVLVGIEFATQGLVTIWFAVGSVFGLFGAAVNLPFLWQLILTLVVSIILLIFTRPVLNEYVNKKLIKTNVETIAGQVGIVKEEIDNISAKGLVMLNGMDWMARAEDNEIIEANTKVVVKKVEGVKLIVKRA